MNLSKPEFITQDSNAIVAEMVAFYETQTGRFLQPAQVERLLINTFAYRESLIRAAIQNAGEQSLVAFARFPSLDYLGDLVGVKRLPAQNAVTTLRFVNIPGTGTHTILAGTRIATNDNSQVFRTTEKIEYDAALLFADVPAETDIEGTAGNGILPGTITKLLDPLAFISTVANTTESTGGADEETDDELRIRIQLAPEAFSTCGSAGAYKYWAKTASQTIRDVAVTTPIGGSVIIYPLLGKGQNPSPELMATVLDICSSDRARPICDQVSVVAPLYVSFGVTATLEIDPAILDPQTVIDAATQAVRDLSDIASCRIGTQIHWSQVVAAVMAVPGVLNTPNLIINNGTPPTAIEAAIISTIDITEA